MRKKCSKVEQLDRVLIERKCPVCGKIFIPAGMHVYRTRDKRSIMVCSYTCENKTRRR